MVYNFNIPDNGSKKAMKLFKKVDKISFMINNGIIVYVVIAAVAFVIIQLLNEFTSFGFFDGHFILALITSICIGGFCTSFYNAILNEHGIYRKLCRALKCSVFVNEIDLRVSACGDEMEEVDGIYIPELYVKYDVDENIGKTVVLLKTNDNINKIIAVLDTGDIGKNKKLVITSKDMAEALKESCIENELVIIRVCQINKELNGYVKDEDIDNRLIIEEAFMKQYEIIEK